ncbi:MAG: CPBP family intramembrane metalloprotease [Bacteroidetes bacterium]|nr:CPBP family intramembrane metalloprotease [Bacteroidota bacterium]
MKIPSFISRLILDKEGDFRYETILVAFWLGSILLSMVFVLLFSVVFFLSDSVLMKKLIIFQSILLGFLSGTFAAWYFFSKKTELTINLGLTNWKWLKLLKGFIVSSLAVLLLFSIGWGLGWVDIVPQWNLVPFGLMVQGTGTLVFLTLIPTITEELMFRGFPLQVNLTRNDRLYRIVLLSAIFSLLHFSVSGVTPLSYLSFFLLGVWFSMGNLAEGTVWYSTGLHFGWNYMQTAIFGLSAKEMGIPGQSVFTVSFPVESNPFLIGNSHGLENGLVTIGLIGLFILTEKFRIS